MGFHVSQIWLKVSSGFFFFSARSNKQLPNGTKLTQIYVNLYKYSWI